MGSVYPLNEGVSSYAHTLGPCFKERRDETVGQGNTSREIEKTTVTNIAKQHFFDFMENLLCLWLARNHVLPKIQKPFFLIPQSVMGLFDSQFPEADLPSRKHLG